MLRIGAFVALFAACLDVHANPVANPTVPLAAASRSAASTSTAAFFATPPASLGAFFPGFGPSQTSVEPQPLITDPVSKTVFPLDLTNPKTIPTQNVNDPVNAFNEITAILNNTEKTFSSTCQQCISSLLVYKNLALTAPWEVPPLLIEICNFVDFNAFGSCQDEFMANSDGQIATQLLANADVAGQDGQWICARDVIEVLSTWFAKPKPANAVAPPPSGKPNMRVVHLSDFHIDPRYTIGAEANCSSFLCCRPGLTWRPLVLPAPRFGAYECDTPWNLASAVMHAVGPLTGTASGKNKGGEGKNNAFTIFTGDLTSHDNDNHCLEHTLFKAYLAGPVYAAMGNHDTWPQAFDAPHSIQPQTLSSQFEWNYAHLADLWETEGWISADVASVSKATYSAYATITPFGLKIITVNTDFWYDDNEHVSDSHAVQTTNPDVSGMLRFLTDELQAAEDAGQRVWILDTFSQVRWDGTSALLNGPNLLYQIIDRFSPHVIANVFMGHIHDEVRYIYYANNGTVMDNTTALTPLGIMEAYTWFADVNDFDTLDHQTKVGAAYHFEYSTRETYGVDATWWHLVTESFLENSTLVDMWTLNQGRQSALTANCTSTECQEAKVCYLRSGSPPIAARCTKGFGSVQM
ncbi:Metallo-dependent phosphatase-like protein [Flammula alnicola]|nr:Metallo-dependent phosphatase-like protein [Flammula alnicola]